MRQEPFLIERIVASLSYLTMGMAGFIWLIISLFTKARLRPFLQYHIFQSIFLSLLFVVLWVLINILSNILGYIPFIKTVLAQIIFWLNMPLIFEYSLIQTIIYLLLLYLAFTSFMGKYSYVLCVSDIIDQNVSHN